MRAPWAIVLLVCCATREPVVIEPEPAQRGDYTDLMVAAIDAFLAEDFEVAETKCVEALRLRSDDRLASDVLMDSRKLRHISMGLYIEERKRLYQQTRDHLRPPAPP